MVYASLVLYVSIVSSDLSNVIGSFKPQESYKPFPVHIPSTSLPISTSPAIRNDYTTGDAINHLLSARKECDLPPYLLVGFAKHNQIAPRDPIFNRSGKRHR